jgi:hypothetical protein
MALPPAVMTAIFPANSLMDIAYLPLDILIWQALPGAGCKLPAPTLTDFDVAQLAQLCPVSAHAQEFSHAGQRRYSGHVSARSARKRRGLAEKC